MKKHYQFGHVQIEINLPDTMPVPENMKKFECQADDIKRYYEISFVPDLNPVVESLCGGHHVKRMEREALTVLKIDGKECRLIRTPDSPDPYAVNMEWEENRTKVWVLESTRPAFVYDTYFISLLSLEKLMMEHDAVILHSAYMCKDGKAVLFSAPSETGKSTQADLWEKYRGTRTINGDRSLLTKEADGWYAYGWPVCGSSGICHNEAYPIEAIVMLYQAKENAVTRLKGMQIVKKLMSQLTINMWNADFQMKVMDRMEELIAEVPVFELGCNISEDAVACLEQALNDGN